MANTNTITCIENMPAVFLNSTAETLLTNVGSATISGVAAGAVVNLAMPAQANVDGRAFRVHLYGKATGGTSATLTLAGYVGSSIVSGNKVASWTVSGAAIPAAGGNFYVFFDAQWDSVSQIIHGLYGGNTNGTATASTTLTNSVASLATPAALNFCFTATFGAALATNSVTLVEAALTQI